MSCIPHYDNFNDYVKNNKLLLLSTISSIITVIYYYFTNELHIIMFSLVCIVAGSTVIKFIVGYYDPTNKIL